MDVGLATWHATWIAVEIIAITTIVHTVWKRYQAGCETLIMPLEIMELVFSVRLKWLKRLVRAGRGPGGVPGFVRGGVPGKPFVPTRGGGGPGGGGPGAGGPGGGGPGAGGPSAGGGGFPDKIFSTKAPKFATPGTKILEGQHINKVGRVEPWKAYYDDYGRQVGRTDYNAGNKADGIPDIHHHLYEYGPGFEDGKEIGKHLLGEYVP